MKKQIIKNVTVNMFSVFWRMLIGFIVMPVMVGKLGPDKYGVWTLAVSFTIVGYLNLAELGIGTAVIKYVSEYFALNKIKQVNQIISSALFFYIGLGFIASGGLLVFTHFGFFKVFNVPKGLIEPTRYLLILLAIKALIDFPAQAISSTMEGLQRYDLWRIIEIIRESLRAVAVLTALHFGKGLIVLGFIFVGESIYNLVVYTVVLRWIYPKWKIIVKVPGKLLKQLITYSVKMFLVRINAIVYNGMDKFIIGAVFPVSFLTSYAIASSIHTIANRTTSLVSLPLLPSASELNAYNNKHRLQILLLKGTKYTLALSTPIIVSLIVLAKPFITVWMGDKYVSVTPLAQLFLSYLFINSLAPVAYNMLLGINKVTSLLKIQIVSTIINLVISLILVYRIGLSGVIWGTVIGTSFAVFPYLYILFKRIDMNWIVFFKETVLKVYPYIVIPTLILVLANKRIPPKSFYEIGLYIILFYIFFFTFFFFYGLNNDEKTLAKVTIKSMFGNRT